MKNIYFEMRIWYIENYLKNKKAYSNNYLYNKLETLEKASIILKS